MTDSEVTVPTASPPNFGIASVRAHALISGRQGNIPAYDIDSVEGSSIYVRNLTTFHGGADAYTVRFATSQDKADALKQTRNLLIAMAVGLHYPCQETITNVLTWRCQFITYSVPSYMRVISVTKQGKDLLLIVVFVARPRLFWAK